MLVYFLLVLVGMIDTCSLEESQKIVSLYHFTEPLVSLLTLAPPPPPQPTHTHTTASYFIHLFAGAVEKTDFDEDEERRSQFTGFDLSAYEYGIKKVKTNDGKEFVREKLAKYDENNYPNSCFFHDTPGFLSDLQVSYGIAHTSTKMKFCQVESLLTINAVLKKTEKILKGKNKTLSSKCIYSDPQLSPAR